MAKNRKSKRLDQFLHWRRQSKQAVLAEKARLANRIFRMAASIFLLAGLLALVPLSSWTARAGLGLLFILVTALGVSLANRVQPQAFQKVSSFNQLVFLVAGTVVVSQLMLVLGWSPYLLPLPILAMVVGMAYSPIIGHLITMALAFYLALLSPTSARVTVERAGDGVLVPGIDLELAIVLCLGATAAILGTSRVRKQSRPVIVGFYVGVVQALAILGFEVLAFHIDPAVWWDAERPYFWQDRGFAEFLRALLRDPAYGFAGGLIAGGVVTSLLPGIERLFGVLTERRLLDLGDPSNNLLRVLRERAPGTFQHTLGVQQLAREAAEAIGADSLLAVIGAYYHDIGKIYKPEYFVENMGEDKSIHDRLRPSMSKLIIISHVKDGILLAREEKLPERVIDMIPMHHGTTVVEFFYQKALRECDEDEDTPAADVEYRYPGPKPTFAEAGILMLADAVEAIAKAMPEPSPNAFREMVKSVIRKRLFDGQLDECNLTLADLHKIEESFVRTLNNMYHSRIQYPSDDARDAPRGGAVMDRPETRRKMGVS